MTEGRSQKIQTAVTLLEKLTALQFSHPSPDLFTLRDFKVRYRLTQLSPIAIEAMEKSQRLSRQLRDYTIIGLCEFHIGLIYLFNEDCLGGLQHFNNAQHQWLFVNEPRGTGLAFFAQGLAQHLYWQFEGAMASFNQVRRWLPRMSLGKNTPAQDHFIELLTTSLEAEYETLRQDLWRIAKPMPESKTPLPDLAQTEEPAAHFPQPPSSPTLNIISEAAIKKEANPPRQAGPANLGISYLIPPGHAQTVPDYAWYLVVTQPTSGFFPLEIQKGSTLLVDKQKQEKMRWGELVVVGHENDHLLDKDAVRVQPISGLSFPILTIAWLDTVDEEVEKAIPNKERSMKHIDLTTSPEMRLIPTKMENIIGVVVGSWYPVTIHKDL